MALQNSNVHWDGKLRRFHLNSSGRRGRCRVLSSERMCALPDRASCSQYIIAQAHGPPLHHLKCLYASPSLLPLHSSHPNCREPEVEAGEDRTDDLGDFTTQCLVTDMAFTNFMPVSWKIRVRCFYAQVWPPADIPELLLCSTVKAKRSSDSNQGISG
ncbi:hypothetical protein NEUTE2DRAFT_65151 [Neurospora tetrasperma FGSC 2509]|nr:hypothetical protein NEUTE2DRAFT_65151 [Neurospora tetrasperma FGSC 2509]